MKLTNRAKSALATAGFPVSESSPIAQLVAFAAQNSGLDFRNYGDVRAYKSEQRSISEDWRRFKRALNDAALDGVTDADVLEAAPHAFSGRCEWNDNAKAWNYCVGQYWPTEFRKAAATVLEQAARDVRQARPAKARAVRTITELKDLNRENGGCWFDPSTMRFFGTRIESDIIGGRYFVTSEQPPHGPRGYCVRSFDEQGAIDTEGTVCEFRSRAQALEKARELAANLNR